MTFNPEPVTRISPSNPNFEAVETIVIAIAQYSNPHLFWNLAGLPEEQLERELAWLKAEFKRLNQWRCL